MDVKAIASPCLGVMMMTITSVVKMTGKRLPSFYTDVSQLMKAGTILTAREPCGN